ncbi:MAG: thioredoxin domain-containing protein [Halobacteriaceae archaeon]
MTDAGDPAEDPTRRNRLDEAASPYLRQHADNPVHWQPWDERALAAARERDVPIFLSIGYAACHWCHVMAEESFEDEAVAHRLNDHFVPIKVDREERPDVDSVYMTVCQLVRGGGCGWPLSVFLTPDGDPFYVGTYFPREARPGQPGFLQLLEDVTENWREDRESLEERAAQWSRAVAGELESVPEQAGDPDAAALVDAASAAVASADREHGGFGTGQKFPQPGRVLALLSAHDRTGREEFRSVATEALDAMAGGGLNDHVGGGFHRYCTDRTWTVPHFEKMLYDNAEIPRAFLAGYQVTGREDYAAVARRTFGFLQRELQHPDGGFYSTLDARSVPHDAADGSNAGADGDGLHRGEEGAFYVWTPAQVRAAVGDDRRADLFCERFGVTEAGNFEGATVLTVSATVEDLATSHDRSPEAVETDLRAAHEAVAAARAERPRPARDEKVLAGWNGLAVHALAEGALVLDASLTDPAVDALSFVVDRLWDGDRLARRWMDGDVSGEGFLEDYAFLARGALATYGATGDVDHLGVAADLGRTLVDRFWDGDRETLYFTPTGGERLLARPQDLADGSTPSPTGVAVEVLQTLAHFLPDEGFSDVAERVLARHADRLSESPLQHVGLATAADALERGRLELTAATDRRPLPPAWRDVVAETYLPDRVLAPRPPTDEALQGWLDALGLAAAPPVWANREARDGADTMYVCRRACSPPLREADEIREWVAEFRP